MNAQRHPVAFVVAGLLLAVSALAASAAAQRIEAEAVSGEPFGVGRIVVDMPAALLPEPLGVEGLGVSEKKGRVLYPAVHNPLLVRVMRDLLAAETPLTAGGPVRQEVGGLLRDIFNRPPRTTIYFLFRGSEPLEMSLDARQSHPLVVRPRANASLHQRLMAAWWREYSVPRRLLQGTPDYPPVVQNYLASMLARRLNQRLPQEAQQASGYREFERQVDIFLGSESVLLGLEQDRVLGMTNFALPADRPLPKPVDLPPLELPSPLPLGEGPGVRASALPQAGEGRPIPPAPLPQAGEGRVEPVAMRVPAECFYVRFGSYANFLWMQDTLDLWNGDLQNLVALRGLDYGRNAHMQEQLVLRQTELTRTMGPALVSDVALIGTDMLFREGAAYGFLFEARNNLLLAAKLDGERQARIKRGGAAERKVKVGAEEVSLLSSTDGRVRSYYAASGDYHFVTSSEVLMRRFLETAKDGAGSLGGSKEFRYARSIMPTGRGDTVFMYVSDAFFRNLTSPRYRTEIIRRLEATADIEVVELAKLAAATEGKPGETLDDLTGGGFLPRDFGPRPDGTHVVIGRGEVYDSLRGRRGTFTPVLDVPTERITQAEEESYRRFAELVKTKWGRFEPIMVGIRRTALPENRERIVIDARMAPLADKRIELLRQWAGPPEKTRLAPVAGNLAEFDAVLNNQRLLGGVQDVAPPLEFLAGPLPPWLQLQNTVIGYLGAYGDLGLLGILDATIVTPPDANGFSRNRLGLCRRQIDRFTVYSFQPDVLAALGGQLRFVETPRPGQLWLRVGDVARAKLTPSLNSLSYSRTRETTLGNLRLVHALGQQLHLPAASCKDAAEFILAAKLICPLGGRLVLKETPDGPSRWTSTALPPGAAQGGLLPAPPAGYMAPPLGWLRGLDLDAAMVDRILSAHAEVVMQLPTKAK